MAKQYLARSNCLWLFFLEKARSFKDSDFDNGYDLSIAYARAGQWEKARAEIHRLVSIRNTPELHSLLGEIESATHHRKAAAAEYQVAAQMDPSETHIFDFGKSLLLFNGDAAVTIFSYGVKKFPLSGRLRTGLGIAYYFYGDFDKAAKTLCEAVDLDPSDPRPIEFLGKLPNESYEVLQEVNERFSTFLKIHPDSATASYYLGRNLLHPPGREPSQDDREQSKQLLSDCHSLESQTSGAYFELGQLSESKGRKEKQLRSTSRRSNSILHKLGITIACHLFTALRVKRPRRNMKCRSSSVYNPLTMPA